MDRIRFEDRIQIEEITKELSQDDIKTILVKIYIQSLKTNGFVKDHDKEIINIKEEQKLIKNEAKDVCTKLTEKIDKKMDWDSVKKFGIVLTTLLSLITLSNLVLGILKFLGVGLGG